MRNGTTATAVTIEGDSPNHRVRVDEVGSDNEPQFVRSIEGKWSKPTLLCSDDNGKVYMPFDDELALGASFPERNWSNSSFEVFLFSSKGRAPTGKWAETWKVAKYTEARVLIDTTKLKCTIVSWKLIDGSGHAFKNSPEMTGAGEVRDLTDPQWTLSRSITGEIVRRLTEPQRMALKALNVRSLDELAWNQELHQQYLTLMNDQIQMRRGLGPEN